LDDHQEFPCLEEQHLQPRQSAAGLEHHLHWRQQQVEPRYDGRWHTLGVSAQELQGLEGGVEVRSVGSLLGIELKTPERSEAVFQQLLEHGEHNILCKCAGRDKKTLVFWMMLNLSEEICAVVFKAVKEAIACTCQPDSK